MGRLDFTSSTWGMTNTFDGRAVVSPSGHALAVRVKTSGDGKFSTGEGFALSSDYPEGVYSVAVSQDGIEISHFPATGGVKPLPDYRLAPEPVILFAEELRRQADCYHCKCLERHLQAATDAAG